MMKQYWQCYVSCFVVFGNEAKNIIIPSSQCYGQYFTKC